jgi:hydrogenase nickel incorporation protein HypA/HybF
LLSLPDAIISGQVEDVLALCTSRAMHELGIAHNLVEIACHAAAAAEVKRVAAVHVRLGTLSGVVKDALMFSYDIAAAGTILEGSHLEIEELPVTIYCSTCNKTVVLPGIQDFCCPHCGTPTTDIRQGRELEVVSLEAFDE